MPVYGMLGHAMRSEEAWTGDRTTLVVQKPPPEVFRAAAANNWSLGVDGLYTWFLPWPLGMEQRGILSELSDPDHTVEGDKRYVLRRRTETATALGYTAPLPLELAAAEAGVPHRVAFSVADDLSAARRFRVGSVQLRLNISNIVTQDRLRIELNGESLEGERCTRDIGRHDAARDQWLTFELVEVLPRAGENVLAVTLLSRPAGLAGSVTVEQIEVAVRYSQHPSKL